MVKKIHSNQVPKVYQGREELVDPVWVDKAMNMVLNRMDPCLVEKVACLVWAQGILLVEGAVLEEADY